MTLKTRYLRDRIVVSLLASMTALVVIPLCVIIAYVGINGIGALSWDFFTEELGSPARALQGRPTGLAHSIVGTLIIDSLAVCMAAPVGIGTGILLSEFPDHPVNPILRVLTSTLNGMPAVLMGMLAFSLVVKPMGRFSALAGSFALALVMLPIIARAVEGVLYITPWSIREAGLALGLPRWRVTLSMVLPAAKRGVVTGVLIAFARAAGEAAPLLFTSFGNNYMNTNILKPMDTLPQRLYSLAISPYRQWHSMGWAAGIVLMIIVLASFAAARLLSRESAGLHIKSDRSKKPESNKEV